MLILIGLVPGQALNLSQTPRSSRGAHRPPRTSTRSSATSSSNRWRPAHGRLAPVQRLPSSRRTLPRTRPRMLFAGPARRFRPGAAPGNDGVARCGPGRCRPPASHEGPALADSHQDPDDRRRPQSAPGTAPAGTVGTASGPPAPRAQRSAATLNTRDLGAGGRRTRAGRGHHGRLAADRDNDRREDRQDPPDLFARHLGRAGRHDHDRHGRRHRIPVSTTHVLSSGVAGTMAANRSGLQWPRSGASPWPGS